MGSDPSPDRAADRDEELALRAGSGDRGALEELLASNYGRIYTLCRRICQNREQAQDATQNALLAIVRGLPLFDGRSKFSTWSYRVASNAAIDEVRRGNRLRIATPTDDLDELHDDRGSLRSGPQGAGGPTDGDPGHALTVSETRRELQAALDTLDGRFRIPMVLRDVGGFDYEEISRMLAIPPGTVRSRISRGRERMSRILAGTELDPRTSEVDEPGGRAGRPGHDRTAAVEGSAEAGNQTDSRNVEVDES